MEGTSKKYAPAEINSVLMQALRIIKGTATFADRFVPQHEILVELVSTLRGMGCVIVFVTGVWDLWHIGHGDYIRKGREEAIKMYPHAEHIIVVVGADSDEFTRSRKGPDRPIVPEDERCRVLGHVRAVDIITLQYQADELFDIVDHDVRIISESTEDLPSLEKIQRRCAHVINLPPQAETSTTARIRRLSLEGAAKALLKIEKALQEVRDESKS